MEKKKGNLRERESSRRGWGKADSGPFILHARRDKLLAEEDRPHKSLGSTHTHTHSKTHSWPHKHRNPHVNRKLTSPTAYFNHICLFFSSWPSVCLSGTVLERNSVLKCGFEILHLSKVEHCNSDQFKWKWQLFQPIAAFCICALNEYLIFVLLSI